MDVDFIFKVAAIGIIVTVLHQLLVRSGREEQATMTTLAALVVVFSLGKKKLFPRQGICFSSAGQKTYGFVL